MTKLAILSDIHGNSVALEAVLKNISQQGHIDMILVLGDLVVFGPDPAGVLQQLRHLPAHLSIRGNTDQQLLETHSQFAAPQSGQTEMQAGLRWTAAHLGDSDLQLLGRLPTSVQLAFSAQHRLLAVHGAPCCEEQRILPTATDTALAGLFQGRNARYNLLLCANTHLPFVRQVGSNYVVNAGSVGLPFDGNPQASYALVTLRPQGGYSASIERVPYSVEKAISQLHTEQHPGAGMLAYNLRAARSFSHNSLFYSEKTGQPLAVAA